MLKLLVKVSTPTFRRTVGTTCTVVTLVVILPFIALLLLVLGVLPTLGRWVQVNFSAMGARLEFLLVAFAWPMVTLLFAFLPLPLRNRLLLP